MHRKPAGIRKTTIKLNKEKTGLQKIKDMQLDCMSFFGDRGGVGDGGFLNFLRPQLKNPCPQLYLPCPYIKRRKEEE
ncbi:hypothetical protein K160097B7_29590 [[Clostridium] hylemonae]